VLRHCLAQRETIWSRKICSLERQTYQSFLACSSTIYISSKDSERPTGSWDGGIHEVPEIAIRLTPAKSSDTALSIGL